MRKWQVILAATTVFWSASEGSSGQPAKRPTQQERENHRLFGRPIFTISTFTEAVRNNDLELAARCVEGAEESAVRERLKTMLGQHGIIFNLELIHPRSTETIHADGISATVAARFRVSDGLRNPLRYSETIALKLGVEGWKIVGAPLDALYADGDDDAEGYLLALATKVAHPQVAFNHIDSQVALSNLRQLGLAAIMFAEKSGGKLAFDNASMQKTFPLWPGAEVLYDVPPGNGQATQFKFNDQLSNVAMDKIREPSSTVMIYDGQNDELNFRYDGRAAVGFTDGRVALVTLEQAASLKFKP